MTSVVCISVLFQVRVQMSKSVFLIPAPSLCVFVCVLVQRQFGANSAGDHFTQHLFISFIISKVQLFSSYICWCAHDGNHENIAAIMIL